MLSSVLEFHLNLTHNYRQLSTYWFGDWGKTCSNALKDTHAPQNQWWKWVDTSKRSALKMFQIKMLPTSVGVLLVMLEVAVETRVSWHCIFYLF